MVLDESKMIIEELGAGGRVIDIYTFACMRLTHENIINFYLCLFQQVVMLEENNSNPHVGDSDIPVRCSSAATS